LVFSTVKSAGAGIDIKNLRCLLVFTPFKSEVMLHQLFGRLRSIPGKAVFYFNVIDEGFGDCVRMANYRNNWLKRKAKSITNMDLMMKDVFSNERQVDII
jgi:superfamily II DNA or RNA helicase